MAFPPAHLGPDARRRLERAFCVSAGVLVIVGIALPSGIAQAQLSFNGVMNMILFGLVMILQAVLFFVGKLVLLLVEAIIGVAQYNDFVKAEPVKAGWPLVRDVVNMFFIVVLLITAFSTIIQYKKFDYRKVLPKLLLMAILVNFSKTLIGLLIDFSQVVMLTFVNGFKAAAAGNFVQVLKLYKILSLDTSDTFRQATSPDTIGGLIVTDLRDSLLLKVFMAELLGVFILGTTLITLLIMLIYLIVRVVGLWIALIMSPAAFFATALESTPLSTGVAFISKNFWPRLGAFLSGGPIMAFFLWLTLATVQSGGFGDFTGKATATTNTQQVEKVGYFATTIGNTEDIATFLVGIVMLLMGIEAAVSISGQASKSLEGGAKFIRSGGLTATRLAAYGGILAGGAAVARGGRRLGGAVARTAESRFDITGGLGRRIQRVSARIPVVGTAIGAQGAKLSGVRTGERKRYAQQLEKATANLSIGDRIKTLEKYARSSINADKKKAALTMLGKLEASSDGMKEVNSRFTKTMEEKGDLRGAELKGYAEHETRMNAARRLNELAALADETNDDDLRKYVREEREKHPDLYTDTAEGDEKLRSLVYKMIDDGDAENFLKTLKSQAYQDPRVIDAVFEHTDLLNDDGTFNERSAWYKVVKKGGQRGDLFKQRAADLQAATPAGQSVKATLERGGHNGMYVREGERWQLVSRDRIQEGRKAVTARAAVAGASAGAFSGTARRAERRQRRRAEQAIRSGRRDIQQQYAQGGPGMDASIRQTQYQMMNAGARIPEAYEMSDDRRFTIPDDRERYRTNVQTAVREGSGDPSRYNALDIDYMEENTDQPNEARTVFAASADIGQIREAMERSPENSGERADVQRAVRVIHDEGSRVEHLLNQHNAENPNHPVSVGAVALAGEENSEDDLRQVTQVMRRKPTLDEARALAQKRRIDHDEVLRNFRRNASERTERARNVAAAQPTPDIPDLVPPTPPQQPPPTRNNPRGAQPQRGGNAPGNQENPDDDDDDEE